MTDKDEYSGQWEASKVKCNLCGYEWVAVRPLGLEKLECSNCGDMVHFENRVIGSSF